MMILAMSFARGIHDNGAAMEQRIAAARALELAQGAGRMNLQLVYLDYCANNMSNPAGPDPRNSVIWLGVTRDTVNGNRETQEPPPMAVDAKYNRSWSIFGQGEVTKSCAVAAVDPGFLYVDLVFTTTARVPPEPMAPRIFASVSDKQRWVYTTVQELVRFNFAEQSRVFDFAYFVNNYGWMFDDGSGCIKLFGNVGANGDLDFRGAPLVDGSMFAAYNPALNSPGNVNGQDHVKYDTLSQYLSFINSQSQPLCSMFPPTNPAYTDDNGVPIQFTPGYSGDLTQYTRQQPLNMPYLGDLSTFKSMAQQNKGSIQQLKFGGDASNPGDWVTIASAVYGANPGENGLTSTVDSSGKVTVQPNPLPLVQPSSSQPNDPNGNVALIGTAAQPLKITGPVVITNDLVLKGTITGQGTIFTGRNLHIVGDVTYLNPPAWQQDDPNFYTDLQTNNTKDIVGFVTKGSVILGDYYHMRRTDKDPGGGLYDGGDYWDYTRSYFRTGFQNSRAQSYQADPTDQVIGYYDPQTKSFAGDYTAADGGQRYDSLDLMQKVARMYYESSFPDQYIASITGIPGKIQGIFYTNHLFGGRSRNLQLWGSVVSRDEGIIFTGTCWFVSDPRSSSMPVTGAKVNIFLPGALGYKVLSWQQLQ